MSDDQKHYNIGRELAEKSCLEADLKAITNRFNPHTGDTNKALQLSCTLDRIHRHKDFLDGIYPERKVATEMLEALKTCVCQITVTNERCRCGCKTNNDYMDTLNNIIAKAEGRESQ